MRNPTGETSVTKTYIIETSTFSKAHIKLNSFSIWMQRFYYQIKRLSRAAVFADAAAIQ
jgi:hypothetical protein